MPGDAGAALLPSRASQFIRSGEVDCWSGRALPRPSKELGHRALGEALLSAFLGLNLEGLYLQVGWGCLINTR